MIKVTKFLSIMAAVIFIYGGFAFEVNQANALVDGSYTAQKAEKEKSLNIQNDDCPAGEGYTKPSPGIGPMQCGQNQCRENGYLYFTACVTQSDCNAMGGKTDGGNKAGCTDVGGNELFCCRTLKNRCNSASTESTKLFLCTTESQCTGGGGTIFSKGSGCQGDYNTCCEYPDAINKPMKIIGETLLPGGKSTFDASGTGTAKKVTRAYEYMDNFCHTMSECMAGGGSFEKGNGCPFKGDLEQGYCVAPEPEYELQYPVFGATKIAGLRNLIGLIFNGSIGVLIIVSAIFFIWGAFKYLVSSVATTIQKTKEIMVDSLVGLALGLGAYALLANINPNVLSLDPGKIYMINRVSFYNVVYCNDLIDKNVKLMDAGKPTAPLSYSEQLKKTGFDTSISETKCGNEYFIEGADTLAVCMGQGCGSGNNSGLCINCTTGLGKDCNSNSAIEHSCSDCAFGGNVTTKSTYKPDEVWLYLFCESLDAGLIDITAEQLGNMDFVINESTKKSTGASSGDVTNICFKKNEFDMSAARIKAFADECKAKSGKNMGMSMFVFIDNELTGNALDMLSSVKRTAAQNPYQTGFQRMIALQALPAYFLVDSATDNSYFFVNKKSCDTNLLETSLSFNEGFLGSFINTEETAFENLLKEFAQKAPEVYEMFLRDVWTIEEAIDIVEKGSKSPCGFGAG